jgi:hypothetical protein
VKRINRTLLWVTIYGVAMGVLEGAVVVYLRRLYYPHGFAFPLSTIDLDVAVIELWREIATIVMLASVGAIAGRNRGERFAYFIYTFGVWDLIYYAALKAMVGWPQSLMTWDILFLIPVPWVGPVITPAIIALTMMAFGVVVVRYTDAGIPVDMNWRERVLLWGGALVAIISFTLEWTRAEGATLWENISRGRRVDEGIAGYVPVSFPWWVYVLGLGMILASFGLFWSRLRAMRVISGR